MKVSGNVKDSSFLYGAFSNWKDATLGFCNHEKSSTHKPAVDVVVTLPRTAGDVGIILSSTYAAQQSVGRQCLLAIAQNIRFLSRLGIPLRGDGNESDSNFMQLLHLRAEDNQQLVPWLQRKSDKYTSPEIQNEIMGIMAKFILRDVAASIKQANYFTLMADEVTDVAKQVAICIRSVNEEFEANEDFVGMYSVECIKDDAITQVLKDVLIRLNLSIMQ